MKQARSQSPKLKLYILNGLYLKDIYSQVPVFLTPCLGRLESDCLDCAVVLLTISW